MIELPVGTTIARLTLIEAGKKGAAQKHRIGVWRCTCGEVKSVAISRVVGGYTRSCGCLSRDITSARIATHRMRKSREYSSWIAMKARCFNQRSKDYRRYGAKGILVCDQWKSSFASFFEHVGPRPVGTSIDRINPTLGYQPGNVRWATPLEQAINRSGRTIVTTPIGRLFLIDYARHIGISNGAANLRLKRGTLHGVTYA